MGREKNQQQNHRLNKRRNQIKLAAYIGIIGKTVKLSRSRRIIKSIWLTTPISIRYIAALHINTTSRSMNIYFEMGRCFCQDSDVKVNPGDCQRKK
jgi:hypothetical protein